MRFLGLIGFFLISGARAEDPAASSRLEEALSKDVGPVCRIDKKDYYLEADQESLCKERGGVIQIASRRGLKRNMNTIESDRYHNIVRPSGPPQQREDGSLNPYNHTEPSSATSVPQR